MTCDNTGKQIVGAPKWTAIVGFDYRARDRQRLSLYAYGNDTYRSDHNLEQLLSPYGVQDAYHLTDAGLRRDRRHRRRAYEIGVVGKNLFDIQYTTSVNDFSNNAPVGYDGIGPRRYVGIDLRLTF